MRTIPSFVHGPEEDGIGDNPVENLRIWDIPFKLSRALVWLINFPDCYEFLGVLCLRDGQMENQAG